MTTRYVKNRPTDSMHTFEKPHGVVHTRVYASWDCFVDSKLVGTLYDTKFGYRGKRHADLGYSCWHTGSWRQVSAVVANFFVGREGFGYERP